LSHPYSETTAFAAPDNPTQLTFALFVSDSLDLPANPVSDVVTITVNNQPPVANAGPDRRVGVETLVTLDGSRSADPDYDEPLRYQWKQTGGLAITLANPSTATPTFTTPITSTTLTFALFVTDSLNLPADPISDEVTVTVGGFRAYMPLVMHAAAPDLVVESIQATAQNVQVVIANRGNTQVADPFYVFVYIDPKYPPSGVNERWWELGATGIAWKVDETAFAALKPGGWLALDEHSYFQSDVLWPLSPGTVLYAHVDAYNSATNYGNVLETHEICGGLYNNIMGPVVLSGQLGAETILSDKPRDIPARP
jgi:hypothetical protein